MHLSIYWQEPLKPDNHQMLNGSPKGFSGEFGGSLEWRSIGQSIMHGVVQGGEAILQVLREGFKGQRYTL